MPDCYAGLMNDGLDQADALRRAQIALFRRDVAGTLLAERSAAPLAGATPPAVGHAHPCFRSAFVLMGNWL